MTDSASLSFSSFGPTVHRLASVASGRQQSLSRVAGRAFLTRPQRRLRGSGDTLPNSGPGLRPGKPPKVRAGFRFWGCGDASPLSRPVATSAWSARFVSKLVPTIHGPGRFLQFAAGAGVSRREPFKPCRDDSIHALPNLARLQLETERKWFLRHAVFVNFLLTVLLLTFRLPAVRHRVNRRVITFPFHGI